METESSILSDARTSPWLRAALLSALERDPVDAANDAECLRRILFARAAEALDANDRGDDDTDAAGPAVNPNHSPRSSPDRRDEP